MSKLKKPDFIVFIGATLYKDLVQRGQIERNYPYVKDAEHVNKFAVYKKSILEDVLSIVKYKKFPTAIFVLDKYIDAVNEQFKELGLVAIEKDGDKIYAINGAFITVKEIDLFDKIAPETPINNRNVSFFKAFGEEVCLQKIEDKLKEHASIIKVLPTWYNIEIKDHEGEEILTSYAKELNVKLLPIHSLRASIVEYLTAKNKTISFAESCTGGLLAAKITSISGASNIIEGSMVTYSNRIKHKWLGVPKDTLNRFGAVSSECVSAMLDGIQKASGADISIAISGIAGPTGGTELKPVGTVYIGIKNGDSKEIKKFLFKGDRGFIQEQSARAALEMLIYSEEEFFDFF